MEDTIEAMEEIKKITVCHINENLVEMEARTQ